MNKPEFSYTLEKEKIRAYKKLSAEDKLKWLEEIFIFTEAALTPKARKVRDTFKGKRP